MSLAIGEPDNIGHVDLEGHDEAVEVGINDASTSHTLQNDDEAISNFGDLDAGAHAEDEPAAGDADNEELAEIDWRDDPAADNDSAIASPATGKRVRVDEELGVDDEQGMSNMFLAERNRG